MFAPARKYGILSFYCLLLFCFAVPCQGQTIQKIEYFIDVDPGFGQATSVAFVAAADVNDLSVAVNTSGLSNGMHTLYMRSQNSNGYWSFTNRLSFVRTPVSAPQALITGLEYFVDSDPGFGNGTFVSTPASADVVDFSFAANLPMLGSGIHMLYVRSKDNSGQWSLTNEHVFVKTFLNTPDIVSAEYFIDTDPGFGLASAIPVIPDDSIPALTFNADVTGLNNGIHTLYVRTKDSNGLWSLTNKHVFVKMFLGSPSIVSAEYFVDSDPGFGMGTAIPLTANDTIPALNFTADVTGLNSGLHTLYVRTKDSNGQWNLTKNVVFVKESTITSENITRQEYFVDTDPGFGNGTSLALPAAPDISNHPFVANVTAYSTGAHTLYVRSKNPTGDWSLSNKVDFTKAFIAPVAAFTASSLTSCAPFTVNFSDASQNSPTTWAWDFDNNGTTDATSQNPSHTYNTPGTYSVKLTVTNSSGSNTITQSSYIVVVANYHTNTTASICQGDSILLGGHYQNSAGTFQDSLLSTNGCDSIVHTTLSIAPLSTPSVSITSNFSIACEGDMITFNAGISNGGSAPVYQWQINGINTGTNSPTLLISTLNDNDNVSCILTTNISCPSQPQDTSNQIQVSILQASAHTITASACGSYTHNSITYNSSGTYTQQLTNALGCDSVLTINLTIHPVFQVSQNLTGCAGDTLQVGSSLYTASGVYTDHFTAINSCDSIITSTITIIDLDTSIYLNGAQLISNQVSGTHQWFNCSDQLPIAGATGVSYTPAQNGSYYVVLYNNGCSDTSGCVNINNVGIDEAFRNGRISVFPNPGSGVITIDYSELNEPIDKLTVKNMLGQTVYEVAAEPQHMQIQLEDLSSGTYYLQLHSGNALYKELLILNK
ncbi:MAG: choice-of-anchor protein [Bacteroidetes bacterium]|jgi:PKD repeat protein|nr:choice-of-anchor protein [Bacteroidota bacterium]